MRAVPQTSPATQSEFERHPWPVPHLAAQEPPQFVPVHAEPEDEELDDDVPPPDEELLRAPPLLDELVLLDAPPSFTVLIALDAALLPDFVAPLRLVELVPAVPPVPPCPP